MSRILKGSQLPTISNVVDLYLVVETEYLLPIGGYDKDCVKDKIELRYAKEGETFIPLNSTDTEHTLEGMDSTYNVALMRKNRGRV